jgi:hypothetical protein
MVPANAGFFRSGLRGFDHPELSGAHRRIRALPGDVPRPKAEGDHWDSTTLPIAGEQESIVDHWRHRCERLRALFPIDLEGYGDCVAECDQWH